jgi:hypothetical protein
MSSDLCLPFEFEILPPSLFSFDSETENSFLAEPALLIT